MSKSVMAELYGWSLGTFRKYIKPIEPELIKHGYKPTDKILTPKHQALIIDHLGPYQTPENQC